MDAREKDLSQLNAYIADVDKEVTMILQSLQWDRKKLMESALVSCRHDAHHRVPSERLRAHEAQCLLRRHGYSKEDRFLPSPMDPSADTLVTYSNEDIREIIHNAAKSDPSLRRGAEFDTSAPPPLTAERLQSSFTSDERRAVYDAVVEAAPGAQRVDDMPLHDGEVQAQTTGREKSQLEVLAELRDMKRRRAKYRTTARTKNYSHALRELISTQMDLYREALGVPHPQSDDKSNDTTQNDTNEHNHHSSHHRERTDNTPKERNTYNIPSTSKNRDEYRCSNVSDRRGAKDIGRNSEQTNQYEHRDYREKHRNMNREDRKGQDDYKRKRHRDDRDEYKHSKDKGYVLDREIKKERQSFEREDDKTHHRNPVNKKYEADEGTFRRKDENDYSTSQRSQTCRKDDGKYRRNDEKDHRSQMYRINETDETNMSRHRQSYRKDDTETTYRRNDDNDSKTSHRSRTYRKVEIDSKYRRNDDKYKDREKYESSREHSRTKYADDRSSSGKTRDASRHRTYEDYCGTQRRPND